MVIFKFQVLKAHFDGLLDIVLGVKLLGNIKNYVILLLKFVFSLTGTHLRRIKLLQELFLWVH